jgi:hypothetical protein
VPVERICSITSSSSPALFRARAIRAAVAAPSMPGVAPRGRGLPSFTPRAFAAARAAFVRSPIIPASSSAAAASMVMKNLPPGPGGRSGGVARPIDQGQREKGVTSEAVELRDDERGAVRVTGGQLGQFGSGGLLAGLDLDVFADEATAGPGDVLWRLVEDVWRAGLAPFPPAAPLAVLPR